MMVKLLNCLTLIVCLMLTACATDGSLSEGFDQSMKAYNRMIRWHEIEGAGATYMDSEKRDEYLKQAELLKKRGISFTDFRILSAKYIPEKKSGDVIAEFDYYILPSNRIKTVSYSQEWRYQEISKSWKLKNVLPSFE